MGNLLDDLDVEDDNERSEPATDEQLAFFTDAMSFEDWGRDR